MVLAPDSSKLQELLSEPATRICYQQDNPKRKDSNAYERYERYKTARTVRDARDLGAAMGDLRFDYQHGFMKLRQRSLSGHRRSEPSREHRRSRTPVRQEISVRPDPRQEPRRSRTPARQETAVRLCPRQEPRRSRTPARQEISVRPDPRQEPRRSRTPARQEISVRLEPRPPPPRRREPSVTRAMPVTSRERPDFGYVISLGMRCLVRSSLDEMKLTRFRSPFDWIYTNVEMVRDCLQDDFRSFLDTSCLFASGQKVGHKRYSEMLNRGIVFIHHDPRKKEDWERDRRAVQRFKIIMEKPARKLFVMAELISSSKAYRLAESTFGLRGEYRDSEVRRLFQTIKRRCAGSFELLVVLMMLAGASHNGRYQAKGASEAGDSPHVRRCVVDIWDGPCRLVVHELHCVGSCTGLRLTKEADLKLLYEVVRDRRNFSLQPDPLEKSHDDDHRMRRRSCTPVREPPSRRREREPDFARQAAALARLATSGSSSSGHRAGHRRPG